jgi:hypothetical protein
MLEVVASYTWPNYLMPIAGLCIRVDALAVRHYVDIQKWDVDGLGSAKGFAFRAASGRVFLLEELEDAVKYKGAKGPYVNTDAADLAAVGAAVLVEEVVEALGLRPTDVVTYADAAAEKRAADLVAKLAATRANLQL